jgi:hypothetical protein
MYYNNTYLFDNKVLMHGEFNHTGYVDDGEEESRQTGKSHPDR